MSCVESNLKSGSVAVHLIDFSAQPKRKHYDSFTQVSRSTNWRSNSERATGRQLLVEIIDGTNNTPDINNSDLMFKNFSAGNESVQPEVRNF
jgi:hypothetical protein